MMSNTKFSWLLQMAWRDSRRSWGRLLLFVSSITLGIAALVAIQSFSENLQKDIGREAKTLLGADLVLRGNQLAPDTLREWIDSIPGDKAEARYFVSMAYFPSANDTRLSQIRALKGDFPFYGKMATEPADAYLRFRDGPKALVEKTLMLQFDLQRGDSVKIGNQSFVIEGQLNAAPGRAGIAGSIAPAIYIPMDYVDSTGLIQMGSRVFYQYYLQVQEGSDLKALIKTGEERLEAASFGYETVENRRANLGEAFDNMTNFLNLVGFIALLLGCIGVASAVHIYVKDKISSVAILRCLGASGRQAFLIYLLQITIFSLLGCLAGAFVGSSLQILLPAVLSDFLPVENVSTDLSILAIGQGVLTGLAISVLFALLPLLTIRQTSPLRTLRASYEGEQQRDPWRWLVYGLIALFIVAFSMLQVGLRLDALFFPLGVGFAFLSLAGLAWLLGKSLQRYFPRNWSYVWRQSIANLYRPQNQTTTLIVSIGLGAALISTLFFIQDILLSQVAITGSGDRPNMILFDIQPQQKEGVAKLTREHGMPLIQQVPIVTMRLDNIDGVDKLAYLKDSTSKVDEWVYNREYRTTYRDTLVNSETVIEGEWQKVPEGVEGAIPISLERDFARGLDAQIGTVLTFNVQGALVKTVVSSIREVDWSRFQTNFFLVFPSGILEKAPQFNVLVSKVEDTEQSARFQQALVKAFPNVSVIDLGQIIKAVDEVLSKVSFVIRFMALFSIFTGLVVLISSIVLSKYQRIKESVLLRTIGASRKQILWINALEYFILGTLATFTGIGLSIIGSWLLAYFTFEVPFTPNWWPPFVVFIVITSLTVLIGLFNTREVVRRPPLEVLRAEIA
ncbi:MAG: FtsX-like permease family protein [Bacteroidota bacterium]